MRADATMPPLPLPVTAEPADLAATPGAPGGPRGSEQFEAFFIAQLFAQMRKTVEAVSEHSSFGSSYFHSMLDEQMAQVTAAAGGFGLAKMFDQDVVGPQVSPASVDVPPEKGRLP